MFAFVHIPRTAGGSIKLWAQQNNIPLTVFGHYTAIQLKEITTWNQCFTVTRNTYSRLISLYLFSKPKAEKNIRLVRKYVEISKQVLENHSKVIEYFTKWYVTEIPTFYNQLEYIKGVDILLSFENLIQDFTKIQSIIGCQAPLVQSKHKKYTKKFHAPSVTPKELLTTGYINTIKYLFAEELDYFDYTVPAL